jgi:hypothetical protein
MFPQNAAHGIYAYTYICMYIYIYIYIYIYSEGKSDTPTLIPSSERGG